MPCRAGCDHCMTSRLLSYAVGKVTAARMRGASSRCVTECMMKKDGWGSDFGVANRLSSVRRKVCASEEFL